LDHHLSYEENLRSTAKTATELISFASRFFLVVGPDEQAPSAGRHNQCSRNATLFRTSQMLDSQTRWPWSICCLWFVAAFPEGSRRC